MSINIGIFSLQQFHNLPQNLGINNITGQHRPSAIRGMKLISLGEPISNVTLGNGVETYPGGWPRFSINRHNEEMKLRFDRDEVYGWQGLEGEPENVDGLADEEYNLIYDDDRTPIGVKLDDNNYEHWLYFIELEDNVSPHDPDEFRNALYGMARKSSNPEQKRGESDNPAAPAALTGEFLGVWGGKKRRKKRTKKKSRKTRKKRKKKTKKRRKKRKRKERKTRR